MDTDLEKKDYDYDYDYDYELLKNFSEMIDARTLHCREQSKSVRPFSASLR